MSHGDSELSRRKGVLSIKYLYNVTVNIHHILLTWVKNVLLSELIECKSTVVMAND